MSLVYMATNTVNGKKYIGYTDRPLPLRISEHFGQARLKKPKKRLLPFHYAIRKHGKDAFCFEVIKDGLSIDEAYILEKKLISELPQEIRYNVSPGGKCPTHGVKLTSEHRRNISLAKRNPTVETRMRLSLAKSGTKLSGKALHNVRIANGYSIVCVNDNKQYHSIVSAAQAYGISRTSISQSCKTGKPTRLGLVFRNENSAPRVKKAIDQRIKSVVCLDDGKVYESLLAASAHYSVCLSKLCQVCSGRRASVNGLHFAYYHKEISEEERGTLLLSLQKRTATQGWCNRRSYRLNQIEGQPR